MNQHTPSPQQSSRQWSDQQVAVFQWFERGRGNLVVRARAGTGKTTTILEAIRHAPENDVLICAFNKRIANELKAKLARNGGHGEVKTLHGVGYSVVQRYWDRAQVDGRRGYEVAKRVAGDQTPDELIGKVAKLVSFAKGAAVAYLALQDREARIEFLVGIALDQGLEPDESWEADGFTVERMAGFAVEALEQARHKEPDGRALVDFDDMIYLPIANGWARPRYRLVVVDEAQDMNATQLELARRVCHEDGRIAVVGDDRQAIYGFRGADSGAIDRLKAELRAVELGLTVTYRCGRAIVDYARTLVPDFTASPLNAAGEIVSLAMGDLAATATPGDFVLSRKNAPLVGVCLKLLRRGTPARIEGKDVAAGLRAIVRRWKCRSVTALVERIDRWREKETEKLRKRAEPEAQNRIALIEDQADVLKALCDGIAAPDELMVRLDTMFGDQDDNPPPAVVCSSIHRSKGLEAQRVFVLKSTLYPQRKSFQKQGANADKALELARGSIEEQNLEYVAVTRAISTLVWVLD